MNTLNKLFVLMGLLSVLCAITTQVRFDTAFAFYAGNACR